MDKPGISLEDFERDILNARKSLIDYFQAVPFNRDSVISTFKSILQIWGAENLILSTIELNSPKNYLFVAFLQDFVNLLEVNGSIKSLQPNFERLFLETNTKLQELNEKGIINDTQHREEYSFYTTMTSIYLSLLNREEA